MTNWSLIIRIRPAWYYKFDSVIGRYPTLRLHLLDPFIPHTSLLNHTISDTNVFSLTVLLCNIHTLFYGDWINDSLISSQHMSTQSMLMTWIIDYIIQNIVWCNYLPLYQIFSFSHSTCMIHFNICSSLSSSNAHMCTGNCSSLF